MVNSRHGMSTNREISILMCGIVGLVMGFMAFMPVIMLPSDNDCQNYYDDHQGCIAKSHELKQQIKFLPSIGFGFGFFGSYVIQWKYGKSENNEVRKTPI